MAVVTAGRISLQQNRTEKGTSFRSILKWLSDLALLLPDVQHVENRSLFAINSARLSILFTGISIRYFQLLKNSAISFFPSGTKLSFGQLLHWLFIISSLVKMPLVKIALCSTLFSLCMCVWVWMYMYRSFYVFIDMCWTFFCTFFSSLCSCMKVFVFPFSLAFDLFAVICVRVQKLLCRMHNDDGIK